MVPSGFGVGDAVARADLFALADGRVDGVAADVADGVAELRTPGGVGFMAEKPRPSAMARTIEPTAPPMERSDAWLMGTRDVGSSRANPGRPRAYPQVRQTCAHAGFDRPQLGHSTVSGVMSCPASLAIVSACGGQP